MDERNALSLLRDGELCNLIVDGSVREGRWDRKNWCFFLTDDEINGEDFCAISDVEEWWPASTSF